MPHSKDRPPWSGDVSEIVPGPRVPTVDDLVKVFNEIDDRVTEAHRRQAAQAKPWLPPS